MQKSAATIGALALGLVLLGAEPALAQTTECPPQSVSLYFEKGKAEFNQFSQALVERMVQEAKSCGAREIVAQTAPDKARTETLSKAFQSSGVRLVVLPRTAPATDDDIASRVVLLRFG